MLYALYVNVIGKMVITGILWSWVKFDPEKFSDLVKFIRLEGEKTRLEPQTRIGKEE